MPKYPQLPRYRRKRAARKQRKARKSKVSKSFASKVRRVLTSHAEKKVYIAYGANQSISSASGTTPTNLILVPTTTQGTGHANRIGNEVNVKSAVVRGFVNLLPYNSVSNPTVGPLYVKMWLLSARNMTNTSALSTSSIATTFFEAGTSSVGFQSNMLDMCLPVNMENFNIHASKLIRLETGATQGSTYYNSAGASCGGNGRFSAPFYFSYGKHMRHLRWDDASPTQPTNKNMFLIFQAVYADGTSLALTPAEYHYTIKIEFTDC